MDDGPRSCRRGAIGSSPPATDERKIVAPVIDDFARLSVRTINDARMLADHLPLSNDDQSFRVDMQAHPSVRKAGGHAVALRRGQQSTGLSPDPSSCSNVIRHVGDTRLLCSI